LFEFSFCTKESKRLTLCIHQETSIFIADKTMTNAQSKQRERIDVGKFNNKRERDKLVWLLLAPFGSFWLLLAPFGSFWLLLAPFGSFWLLLAPFGSFWLLFHSFLFHLLDSNISPKRIFTFRLQRNLRHEMGLEAHQASTWKHR
jgi:hypothetical protein